VSCEQEAPAGLFHSQVLLNSSGERVHVLVIVIHGHVKVRLVGLEAVEGFQHLEALETNAVLLTQGHRCPDGGQGMHMCHRACLGQCAVDHVVEWGLGGLAGVAFAADRGGDHAVGRKLCLVAARRRDGAKGSVEGGPATTRARSC
jgi:hypothetical protein